MNLRLSIFSLLAFLSLSATPLWADDADKVQKLLDEAVTLFQANDFDQAMVKLDEAQKLSPQSPFILNLMGATMTKKKDYIAAKGYFDRALDLDFSFFPARFNVGELIFLQKQYPQALAYFVKLLGENPTNELLQFKVVVCLIQTEQVDEAQKTADAMKYPGLEPAWYFAHAAVALKKGNKAEASRSISAADTLYGDKTALYHETFGDLQWPN